MRGPAAWSTLVIRVVVTRQDRERYALVIRVAVTRQDLEKHETLRAAQALVRPRSGGFCSFLGRFVPHLQLSLIRTCPSPNVPWWPGRPGP